MSHSLPVVGLEWLFCYIQNGFLYAFHYNSTLIYSPNWGHNNID
ncbi:MAG: hypothetical protein H6Q12_1116 [Bacteroidetes bacterium]|nr:hypothetical protein [Bacteroidota bacterium]